MWERKVLKDRAKIAFKANYWKCVLVALVLALLMGGANSFQTGLNYKNTVNLNNPTEDQSEDYSEQGDETEGIEDLEKYLEGYEEEYNDIDDIPNIIENFTEDSGNEDLDLVLGGLAAVLIVIVLIATVAGVALGLFVFNPLEVGCRKFFLDNSYGNGAEPGVMGFAFKTDYLNIVKVQFFRSLFVFLWTLLLIVPGIIKGYEYMLVPYLLAENPSMDRKECLETSKNLMYGYKWDAFILKLSFIGWDLLSFCTLGFLGLFYVNPYEFATEVEMYHVLRGRKSGFEGAYAETYRINPYGQGQGAPQQQRSDDDIYVTFDMSEDNSTHD